MEVITQVNGVTANKKKDGTDINENLWSAILGEVQTQSSTKLPSNKSLLVLGDNASGKTTLIAKLQGVEDPKKGAGLEYAYIDVRDEYRDDVTRLGVWVLDGDTGHTNLLRYALNESNFSNTLVILTVSMTTPWSWEDQLQNWIKVLSDHIDKLKLEPDERTHAKQRLEAAWQNYCETGVDDLDPGSPLKRTNRLSSIEDDVDALPLPDGVLTINLGVDIVVVVTKTDYMTTLEKELDYRDEHFDFMQQWIRTFCLQYGASLFYTSVKEDKNCDLLYKYLTHRIYGLPFRTPALVVEKDAVLIPAGWDNMKKISILYENMQSCKPEDPYSEIIATPPSRKTVSNREIEVQTEDEQAFLAKQQQILQQQGQTPIRGDSPLRVQSSTGKTPTRPVGTGDNRSPGMGPSPVTPGGEGVLANFFNSLLHKKSGSPGTPSLAGTGSPASARATPNGTDAVSDKLSMRTDAAAELDRLTRSAKKDLDFSSQPQSSDC